MERLKQFAVFADGHAEEKTVSTRLSKDTTKQNVFGGIAPNGVSVFQEDIEPSQGELIDSIPGCKFVMVSTKIFLWNLQTQTLNIYGINDPFKCKYYSDFLRDNLESYALAMLQERMEHFSEYATRSKPILFGVNDIIKVLPARLEDRYMIVHLGGDVEIISNPNTTLTGKDLVDKLQSYVGGKVWKWIKNKVAEIAVPHQERNNSDTEK